MMPFSLRERAGVGVITNQKSNAKQKRFMLKEKIYAGKNDEIATAFFEWPRSDSKGEREFKRGAALTKAKRKTLKIKSPC
jgi:hypothetical protein